MALIKCPECKRDISSNAQTCIHCGFPIQEQISKGKVIFRTSNDFIGQLGRYTVKDENGLVIATLKANDSIEIGIDADTSFYVCYSGGFTPLKEAFAPADSVSQFSIGLANGDNGIYIVKV